MAVPELDLFFMNCLINSTVEILKIQCQFDATPVKAFTKGTDTDLKDIAISGFVVLTGQCVNGSVALCFPARTFLTVMGGMLGEKYDILTPDIEDGACELMNMVFGSAKKSLAQHQQSLDRVVPKVLKGNNLIIDENQKGPIIIVPFLSNAGEFKLEFQLYSN